MDQTIRQQYLRAQECSSRLPCSALSHIKFSNSCFSLASITDHSMEMGKWASEIVRGTKDAASSRERETPARINQHQLVGADTKTLLDELAFVCG